MEGVSEAFTKDPLDTDFTDLGCDLLSFTPDKSTPLVIMKHWSDQHDRLVPHARGDIAANRIKLLQCAIINKSTYDLKPRPREWDFNWNDTLNAFEDL